MLGSRFAVLMLFTRIFKQWILGVLGKSGCQGFIPKLMLSNLTVHFLLDKAESGLFLLSQGQLCYGSSPLLRFSELVCVCFKGWIFNWLCVFVCVSGVHWLGATFWMVSQQTDIIRSTSRWRLFNLVLGAIHIFLFLNVKWGQSRYRMAGFYLVCACVCLWSVHAFLGRAINKKKKYLQHLRPDKEKRKTN